MRRLLAGAAALAVLATGCTSSSDDADVVAPTTASTAAPSTGSTSAVSCRGIGAAPANGGVTWISAGRLYDESGCLVDMGGTTLAWGGKADRVLIDGTVVLADRQVRLFDSAATSLSRPTGTAVLSIRSDGTLQKRELDAPTARDLAIVRKHEFVVYHPAGRSIVVAGTGGGGGPELVITDNEGNDAKPLLEIEQATSVGNPVFTASGALLYTADHGDRVDLHRLEIGEDRFTTPDSVPAPGTIDHVVASPFDGGGVAWMKGECRNAVLRAQRGGVFFETAGTEVGFARPVGWLPDGGLVLLRGPTCGKTGDGNPGILYVWKDGAARRIADNVTTAAVRAVLPPPPDPPRVIPQEAPA